MTQIDEFLRQNIDEYMLHDLRDIKRPCAQVGYPLVMTVFAGMELLGGLLSSSKYNYKCGRHYFADYWTSYLYVSEPNRHAFGKTLYQRMRNSIAHAFLLTGGIGVTTADPTQHLTVASDGLFHVDAVQLADDFIESYTERVAKPLAASGASSAMRCAMQKRLEELERAHADTAVKHPLVAGAVAVASAAGMANVTTSAPIDAKAAVSSSVASSVSGPSGSLGS